MKWCSARERQAPLSQALVEVFCEKETTNEPGPGGAGTGGYEADPYVKVRSAVESYPSLAFASFV